MKEMTKFYKNYSDAVADFNSIVRDNHSWAMPYILPSKFPERSKKYKLYEFEDECNMCGDYTPVRFEVPKDMSKEDAYSYLKHILLSNLQPI